MIKHTEINFESILSIAYVKVTPMIIVRPFIQNWRGNLVLMVLYVFIILLWLVRFPIIDIQTSFKVRYGKVLLTLLSRFYTSVIGSLIKEGISLNVNPFIF